MSANLGNGSSHTVFPSIEKQHQQETMTNGSAAATSGNAPQLNASLENAKNTIYTNASAAADTIKNHPMTQSVANGPVAANLKDQSAKTSNEFSNLAASRATPSTTAATGQPLTHYHSFFTNLLSWNNPRASGIAYAVVVAFIFCARYLNILRYALKGTCYVLAITVFAEVLGQTLLSTGLASQFRPRKYYTISKDTLDAGLGDVHELINFFVIESQRIVFVENPLISGFAFVAAFLAYHLIKFVPFWGLSMIATSAIFLGPLIYKTNKEAIDHYIVEASQIVNKQTKQVKNIASENMAKATSTTKQYVGDYTHKAQDLINNARRSSSPIDTKSAPVKQETSAYQESDFPAAPRAQETSAYQDNDFPTAPKAGFTAPSVRDSINALRDEKDPLIGA